MEPTPFFSDIRYFSAMMLQKKSESQFPISTTYNSMIDFQVTLCSTHFVRKCLLGFKNTSQIFEKLSTPTSTQQIADLPKAHETLHAKFNHWLIALPPKPPITYHQVYHINAILFISNNANRSPTLW